MHGLSISPDIDTVTYTLAGAIDPERGWGLRDETWRAMEALARFVAVRPDGSLAAPTWFNLGDHDLATHFYRTARLAEGATLTEVTAEIARRLRTRRHAAADDRRPGRDPSRGGHADGEISFQEYFVQRRHAVPVRSRPLRRRRVGAAHRQRAPLRCATPTRWSIAPSNPIVSIGPLRALARCRRTARGTPRHGRRPCRRSSAARR